MAMAGVYSPLHFVRLNLDLREDLRVWGRILAKYSGQSLFKEGSTLNQELELFADASGVHGFGAFFQGQ